jgi:hypothetical protein
MANSRVFLPLLQSGPRLTFNTQGSAKPPPWAILWSALRASLAKIDSNPTHPLC